MSRYNRTCILCGKQYKYCMDCRSELDVPAFYNIYCSKNCRAIFNILVEFAQNHITKEQAQEQLASCDLSNQENFRADMKAILNQIIEPAAEEKAKEETQTEEAEPEKEYEDFRKKRSMKKRY